MSPKYPQLGLAGLAALRRRLGRFERVPPIRALLAELRDRLNVAYLLISHDISVVAYLADRIAVMYRGRIVETGARDAVLSPPHHPYTEALL